MRPSTCSRAMSIKSKEWCYENLLQSKNISFASSRVKGSKGKSFTYAWPKLNWFFNNNFSVTPFHNWVLKDVKYKNLEHKSGHLNNSSQKKYHKKYLKSFYLNIFCLHCWCIFCRSFIGKDCSRNSNKFQKYC